MVRLIVMCFLYKEQLAPGKDHWAFAYEIGRIARSIAEGHGIGSPLFANTGPSAWMTPLFPYLVAGVFKVFGIYTEASAFALLILDAIISALTCIPIFFIAREGFGTRVAKYSAWAWVVFPYAVYFPVERIWPTWLATLFLMLLFLMVLHLKETDNLWMWTAYGLLWAVAALNEPTLLTVLPFLSIWACYHLMKRRKRWLAPAAVSAIAFVLVVSPWFVRNYKDFHQFIPFRDTMGLEWIIGNSGDSFHWRPAEIGPWHNQAEWRAFQREGELAYMADKKRQAFHFIDTHWGWFAAESLRRFGYIWTGFWSFNPRYLAQEPLDPPNVVFSTTFTLLMLFGLFQAWKERRSAAVPYVLVLLVFPAIYYVTHPEVYYRREIDPLMLILAMVAVTRWRPEGRVVPSAVAAIEESAPETAEALLSRKMRAEESPAD